jgi:hypothetical protein
MICESRVDYTGACGVQSLTSAHRHRHRHRLLAEIFRPAYGR